MDGAKNIDTSSLRGKMMINLDSEDEGVFTVSCAGGNRTRCILPIKREEYDGETLKITVSGLKEVTPAPKFTAAGQTPICFSAEYLITCCPFAKQE